MIENKVNVQSVTNNSKYFPNFSTMEIGTNERGGTSIDLRTIVRKEFDGKWYETLIRKVHLLKPEDNKNKLQVYLKAIKEFISEVYKYLIIGNKIDSNILNYSGNAINPKSVLQISEKERLTQIYNLDGYK